MIKRALPIIILVILYGSCYFEQSYEFLPEIYINTIIANEALGKCGSCSIQYSINSEPTEQHAAEAFFLWTPANDFYRTSFRTDDTGNNGYINIPSGVSDGISYDQTDLPFRFGMTATISGETHVYQTYSWSPDFFSQCNQMGRAGRMG